MIPPTNPITANAARMTIWSRGLNSCRPFSQSRPHYQPCRPPARRSLAVSHAPTPSVSGHDWMARGQREIPHTITRAPDSPPQLSLHPSMAIVSEPAAQQLDHGCERPPPSSTRSSSPLSTRPSQSGNSSEDDDEGLARLQRLSIAEMELRLVQRDMSGSYNYPRQTNPLSLNTKPSSAERVRR